MAAVGEKIDESVSDTSQVRWAEELFTSTRKQLQMSDNITARYCYRSVVCRSRGHGQWSAYMAVKNKLIVSRCCSRSVVCKPFGTFNCRFRLTADPGLFVYGPKLLRLNWINEWLLSCLQTWNNANWPPQTGTGGFIGHVARLTFRWKE